MLSKKIKTIALVALVAIGLSFLTPVSAFAAEVKTKQVYNLSAVNSAGNEETVIPTKPNSEINTAGVKYWAIKGVAKALKSGARNKLVRKAVVEYFDGATSKVFLNSLDDIAYVLEDALAVGETASAYIYDSVYNVIFNICGDYGISHSIADGINALISILVF